MVTGTADARPLAGVAMGHRLARILALTLAAGCGQAVVRDSSAPVPAGTINPRTIIDEIRAQDRDLRRRFGTIQKGMTRDEVTQVMQVGRSSKRTNCWRYKISPFSWNRLTERDVALVVWFKDDRVVNTTTSYICIPPGSHPHLGPSPSQPRRRAGH